MFFMHVLNRTYTIHRSITIQSHKAADLRRCADTDDSFQGKVGLVYRIYSIGRRSLSFERIESEEATQKERIEVRTETPG